MASDQEWWDALGGVPGVEATPEACKSFQMSLQELAAQEACDGTYDACCEALCRWCEEADDRWTLVHQGDDWTHIGPDGAPRVECHASLIRAHRASRERAY
jgi:hypothetical protein